MRVLITAVLITFLAFTSNAQHQKYSCEPGEKAFDGNDLVSYYQGTVKQGLDQYKYTYDGLVLYFSSSTNLATFKKDPEKYVPAYNGWCAIALTNGILAKPDFGHYKIQNGKLLFFEVRAFFNGKTAWEKDPDINEIVADKKFDEMF